MSEIQLTAESRNDIGKGASRRLRHQDKVPAIVYGADKQAQSICLIHKQVVKALENEEFYTQILTLNIDNKPEQVVVKDIQRHSFKPKILHMDFLRIKAGEEISMHIPLHFIGEEDAPGVKEGGTISHSITEVEIRCLPTHLPKHLELDLSKLQLNETLHLSDIKLPEGVILTALAHDEEHNQPVVSIHMARIVEEAPAAETEEGTTTEETAEAAPKEATKE